MFALFIVLFIVYVWYFQFYRLKVPITMFTDNIINNNLLKTGDMILFKAFNNYNSIFTANYFGHIGIIYIDPDDKKQIPMLFEANGIEGTPLMDHHSKKGIYVTPVRERIKKYKGMCFWKPLNKEISGEKILEFKSFINYALDNMEYNHKIFSDALIKGLGLEKCTKKTNCAQLAFLSLIKLDLLPVDYYHEKSFHHLKWMSNIKELKNGYKYLDLIEIIEHPFAE